MPGARRIRKKMVRARRNAELRLGGARDGGGPDRYDGRANTQAGSRGKEPGGRWSPAYYESPAKIVDGD